MKLYEIDEAILALVDPETGELLDYEAFQALQMEREQKLEHMALWVKDLRAEAAAIQAEIATLRTRQQASERKAARLSDYLRDALGGEKFETARCAVSYRKSDALQVVDVRAAAQWLEDHGYDGMVRYSDPSIDKTAVKKLLKGGEAVPGTELESRSNLVIK